MKAIEKENAKFDEEWDNSKSNNSETELKTAEDYHDAIKTTITKLSAKDKSLKQAKIAETGLPKAYQKLKDIEQLKTYLNIVSN